MIYHPLFITQDSQLDVCFTAILIHLLARSKQNWQVFRNENGELNDSMNPEILQNKLNMQ